MTRPTALLTVILAAALAAAPHSRLRAGSPTVHRLEATPKTIAYGYYWSEAKPVLRIASGDIIDVDTLLTNTPQGLARAGVPDDKIQTSLKAIEAAYPRGSPDRGPGGHILTGPVYVDGAEPGNVLEVRILSIDLAIDYGYNGCSGFLPDNCGPNRTTIIPFDRRTMTATFAGLTIPLHPFYGSMGVAPAPELGRVSSNPPGRHAGNLDNKDLVAGSTVYIPVFVPGALFEIGDGQAAQGDGEVDQTAIETSLRGRLQLTVRKDMTLTWPRAETPTAYVTMATDPDLTVATREAIQEMVDFLSSTKSLTRQQAYQLTSIAGDVHITQLVDKPVVGVHVTIDKHLFDK
jgi:acetamidase/formamidase